MELTSLTYQPTTKSSDRLGHSKRHVFFAKSERKPAYQAHVLDMHEDEDENEKPLVRLTSRKESVEEGRGQAIDDEDVAPLVPSRHSRPPETAQRQKRKGPPVLQDPTAFLKQQVSRDSREREEETSIWGKKSYGEALRNIINKLSDDRNLKDFHLKHYQMSTAQFKKRTTHLDIPGRTHDVHQHLVKTCPFCNSIKPRCCRVSGLRAEEFGDSSFWTMDRQTLEKKLWISDCFGWSHTACLCRRTSPSERISELFGWMDTFQMNPKAIFADMAIHRPHDMQAFYRMHNVKRLPTGPHTSWPNRAEMGVRLFKKFLLGLVDAPSKNLDQTPLAQITLALLMRKAATVRNTQVTF